MYFLLSKFDNSIVSNVPSINFPINGLYVITIPSGVQINTSVPNFGLNTPNSIDSLIGQKFGGLLSLFQQYTSIVFDPLDNTTGIDFTAVSPTYGKFGNSSHQILTPARGTTVAAPGVTLPATSVPVISTAGFPTSGEIAFTSSGNQTFIYTSTTATSFVGTSQGTGNLGVGAAIGQADVINTPTVPNGTTTTFTANTEGIPLVPSTITVYWNPGSGVVPVATDNGLGTLTPVAGAPAPAVTFGLVNYTTGAISVTFSSAPPSGSLSVGYTTGGTMKTTVFQFGSTPTTPTEIQSAYDLFQIIRVINNHGGLSDMYADTNLDGSVNVTITFVSAANYPTSGSIVGQFTLMNSVPVLVTGAPYAFLTFSNNSTSAVYIQDWALLWR